MVENAWLAGAVVVALSIGLGASLGSFINAFAHRVHALGTLVTGRSRCPSCETPIRVRDNVPIVSWFALRARCRTCRTRIPLHYPLVEIAGAAAGGLVGADLVGSVTLSAVVGGAAFVLALAAIRLSRSAGNDEPSAQCGCKRATAREPITR